MIRRIGLVLCVVLATVVHAQEKSLLSLELRAYLDQAAPEDYTDLYLRGDVSAIETYVRDNDGSIKRSFRNIVSATLPNTAIWELNQLNGLEYIEFSNSKPQLLNDVMLLNNNVVPVHAGAAPLSQPYTGSDVIMGFVDTGIELEHPDFQDADGNTRVLYIWDQTQVEEDLDRIPQPYNYGQEYNQQDILENIDVHEDQGIGHGTTVTGTGAGNGLAIGNFKGVAPDANIIVVASDFDRTNWKSSVADAVDYIRSKAEELGMPAVVNLSLGDYAGSHDGLDAAALDIDDILESTNGFSVVSAAGNSGNTNFGDYHLSYAIPVTDTAFTWFDFVPGIFDDGAVFFEVWADQEDFQTAEFALGVDANSPEWEFRGYSGWRNALENLNTVVEDTVFFNGNIMGIVQTWVGERGDQYEIEVLVTEVFNTQYPWRFATTGGGLFDLWSVFILNNQVINPIRSENLPSVAEYPPVERYRYPDNLKTVVDSWNCSDKVISVGSYVNRSNFINYNNQVTTLPVTQGEISPVTSRGPTRDNRQKPTISATGHEILSTGKIETLNDWIVTNTTKVAAGGWHHINGGTSYASPVVAGIAALYYECNPNADYQDIIDALIDNAVADEFTGALPGLQAGHGKVDAYGVLTDCVPFLSVDDGISNTQDFRVFPNPSSGNLTIKSSRLILSVEVYNLSGQLIKSVPMRGGSVSNQYNLDLSAISSGLYVLKAIDSDGLYNTSRVLLEK